MRYVAIGDSYTEGVGDERPDGTPRGWADLVAAGLAAGSGELVQYANLAVRGRLLEPIVTDQLDAALSLAPPPTLVSLNGGGNDMLRPKMDVGRLVGLTEQAVRRCADAGTQLFLLTGGDPSFHLPFGKTLRRRGDLLTAAVADIARRYDVLFVDVFHDAELRRSHYWAEDRLHLNGSGHQRVAHLVLSALGHTAAADEVLAAPTGRRGVLAEARYYRQHAAPWVNRRLRGRSSGDGRVPKHPTWVEVPPG